MFWGFLGCQTANPTPITYTLYNAHMWVWMKYCGTHSRHPYITTVWLRSCKESPCWQAVLGDEFVAVVGITDGADVPAAAVHK